MWNYEQKYLENQESFEGTFLQDLSGHSSRTKPVR